MFIALSCDDILLKMWYAKGAEFLQKTEEDLKRYLCCILKVYYSFLVSLKILLFLFSPKASSVLTFEWKEENELCPFNSKNVLKRLKIILIYFVWL